MNFLTDNAMFWLLFALSHGVPLRSPADGVVADCGGFGLRPVVTCVRIREEHRTDERLAARRLAARREARAEADRRNAARRRAEYFRERDRAKRRARERREQDRHRRERPHR